MQQKQLWRQTASRMHPHSCITDICGMLCNYLLRVASVRILRKHIKSCEGICALCSAH